MNIESKTTALMVLTAVLWLLIWIFGWLNIWFPGFYFGLALMFIYMTLGVAKEKKVNKKILLFPLISFVIIWGISFALSYYYGNMFAGVQPEFTFLGLHPSFAPTVFLYWFGGIITLTFGFMKIKDSWLTEEDWNNFVKNINKIDKTNGGGNK